MAQQAQQQSGEHASAPLWLAGSAVFLLWLIWYTAHKYIVAFVFFMNVLQAKVIHFFIGNTALADEIYIMQTVDPASVTWKQLMFLSANIGQYTRYPIIAILIMFALYLYKSNIILKFRRTHDMSTLRTQEQFNWPAIMPVIKLDLVDTDISVGPWAMALTPMEFARKYELLKKEDVLLENPVAGMEMTAGIRRGDAKRVFTLQLGPYWDGFEHCAPHVCALAAVFMARLNRDRGAASHILDTIDKSVAMGKPNYAVAMPTLRKYQHQENVQEIISMHAYLLTVMASLLLHSREDGVVPSAEFLWLKPVDRRLWYMLNSVGRQTPFAEIGGPFAHWLAEKAMGRGSLVPMIDEAIKALEIAVKEIKLTPKEMKELLP